MSVLLTLWQRIALVSGIGLAAGLIILALRYAGFLESWELWQYDITTSHLAKHETVPDVVLLAITDGDLARWGWPLPDAELAALTRAALNSGALAVGIDIYRDVPVGTGRRELIEALRDPRVTVISRLSAESTGGVAAPDGVKSGFADIPIDADGVARRALLLVNTDEGVKRSFPLQVATTHLGMSGLQPAPGAPDTLLIGETAVPRLPAAFGPYRNVDNAGYQVLTQYRHKRPIASRVAAQSVLSGSADLRGQSVVIAVTSDTVKDYFLTPLNRRTGAAFSFGGEVHAAAIQQILDHSGQALAPMVTPRPYASIAMITATALAGAAMAALLPLSLIAFACACIVGTALLSLLSLAQAQAVLLPAVPVTLAWGLAYVTCFALLASIAWRQRQVMAGIFASQLSEALSTDLWHQRKTLMAGRKPVSRRLFVTVLMADIEGSTRIGQSLEPENFMGWISGLLDALGDCAQRHGGFVEKYTGDGILVVFGAPVPHESRDARVAGAQAALACAEEMRALAHQLSSTRDGPAYRLRMGLNSGEVVAGTLGTSGAMRYNVIGDTVNLAARLEAWIKSQPDDRHGMRPICMTEATAELIGIEKLTLRADRLLHDDGETYINVYSRD